MTKLKLTRSLRKKLKQGHPWVYQDAMQVVKGDSKGKVTLASLVDNKGEVTKGLYDPQSSLAFRAINMKSMALNELKVALQQAYRIREGIDFSKTNAFRLIAGEGDYLPGFICDVYGEVAVFQFDGQNLEDFWLTFPLAEYVLSLCQPNGLRSVVLKSRQNKRELHLLAGEEITSPVVRFKENNILFETDLEKAQKTGFFLDQRDNREYVRQTSKGKNVWNIFSYTGGFSVYAGMGGAKKVHSVDISQGAVEQASINWSINELDPANHEGLSCDAFQFLKSEQKLKADLLIVDPPSMTSSKDSKFGASKKYVSLFEEAARNVRKGGDLILSSCSSQVTFENFKEITFEALSAANKKGRVLRVSGQGVDHPYPHACEELRYLKFMHILLDH